MVSLCMPSSPVLLDIYLLFFFGTAIPTSFNILMKYFYYTRYMAAERIIRLMQTANHLSMDLQLSTIHLLV